MTRKSWTAQEDVVLCKRVKLYGVKQWTKVAEGIPNRTAKSCSERWRHFLDPNVKSPSQLAFNDYEAAVIVRGHEVHGNKWQAIAEMLPGRSCRAVKNFWHTNMGANAVARGAIVISNPYLAAGHALEELLAMAPSNPTAASPASSACADARRVELELRFKNETHNTEAKPFDSDHASQQLLINTFPQATLLPMPTAAPQPQPASMQLLTQAITPLDFAPSSSQQQLQQEHKGVQQGLRGLKPLAGDALTEQLLAGFCAGAPQAPTSSSASTSSGPLLLSQAPTLPLASGQLPLGAFVDVALGTPEALEQLLNHMTAEECEAMLADFDEFQPLFDEPWSFGAGPVQQEQHAASPTCPCCRAEAQQAQRAGPEPYASSGTGLHGPASPASSQGEAQGSPTSSGDAHNSMQTALFAFDGTVDLSQMAVLLAEQERRITTQQQLLEQQQAQLAALRAQLTQWPPPLPELRPSPA